MNSQQLFDDLQQRGLIAQSTPLEALVERFATPQVLYCGFDPTAGSLHIGHLVPLLMLKRFQNAGHQAIALIGGATGMIGDPSFKANERVLNSAQTVQQWVSDLSQQITQLMTSQGENCASLMAVNNADWIGKINLIDFFRDVGKHFSVNAMINRESVKQRLARPVRIKASLLPSSVTLCCNLMTLRISIVSLAAHCKLVAMISGAILSAELI